MKVAVIGTRTIYVKVNQLDDYLPENTTELVSGGARGIDCCARIYAIERDVKISHFIPEYEKYGKSAPLKRNIQIIEYSDMVLAFWDGKSHGTEYVIKNCHKMNVPCRVYMFKGFDSDNNPIYELL